jgi:hypothetical protein
MNILVAIPAYCGAVQAETMMSLIRLNHGQFDGENRGSSTAASHASVPPVSLDGVGGSDWVAPAFRDTERKVQCPR